MGVKLLLGLSAKNMALTVLPIAVILFIIDTCLDIIVNGGPQSDKRSFDQLNSLIDTVDARIKKLNKKKNKDNKDIEIVKELEIIHKQIVGYRDKVEKAKNS